MIPDSEIPKCPKFEVKSKIGKLFMNEIIYEIDPYFYGHYKEEIKVDKNERKYILFKIDVYFTEYLLAIEIDEQNHEGRDLIFEKKKKKDKRHYKKNLIWYLLELIQVTQKEVMIQTMKLAKYKYLLVNLKKKNKRTYAARNKNNK